MHCGDVQCNGQTDSREVGRARLIGVGRAMICCDSG